MVIFQIKKPNIVVQNRCVFGGNSFSSNNDHELTLVVYAAMTSSGTGTNSNNFKLIDGEGGGRIISVIGTLKL